MRVQNALENGHKGNSASEEETPHPEQITRKLREADRLLAEGRPIAEVAKHLEISEQTFHRWRNQYSSMKADDAKELKELRKENQQLKEMVADKELNIRALEEIAKGKF